MNLVNYRLYHGGELPPPTGLYEYVLAANGVFVRAVRAGLYACIPVAHTARSSVRGLAEIETTVVLTSTARFPRDLMHAILDYARARSPLENLTWAEVAGDQWRAWEPFQLRTSASVRPVDPFDPIGARALLDLHSHHEMDAFFSTQDDRDESSTFRLYGVLGKVSTAPEIILRVGIYGHFYDLDPGDYLELPYALKSAWERDNDELERAL